MIGIAPGHCLLPPAPRQLAEAAAEREGVMMPNALLGEFHETWTSIGDADGPQGWESSVARFAENGMTANLLKSAAVSALTRDHIAPWHKFRYFCGICWKVIGELRESAEAKLASEGGDSAPVV